MNDDITASAQGIVWNGGGPWIGLTDVRIDYHSHHAIQLGLALTLWFVASIIAHTNIDHGDLIA